MNGEVDRELDELIERHLNGELDDAGRARLEAAICSSPEAARRFARAARFERLIERHLRRPSTVLAGTPAAVRRLRWGWWRGFREHAWGPLAAVALHALLIGALIRWVMWPATPRREETVEVAMETRRESTQLDRLPEMPAENIAPGFAPPARPELGKGPGPDLAENAAPPIAQRPLVAPQTTVRSLATISHPLVASRWGARREAVARELPAALAAAVDRATAEGVEWLAGRQSADGAWREAGTDGLGLTGLAVLALLTRGEELREKGQAERLRAAMDHLAASLRVGTGSEGEDLRGAVLRLNALADGQVVLRLPRWQAALERAAARVLDAQQPDGGWGTLSGVPDPVVTAWAVCGLRVAATIGVEPERIRAALPRAAAALNRTPNPASGLLYYPAPSERSAAAVGGLAGTVLALQIAGEGSGLRVLRGLRSLDEHWNDPGRWLREAGGLDALWLAAWAHQQAGGAVWTRFYARCAPAVLLARTAGSAWETEGRASVRATSVAVLLLETPWRYPRAAEWPALAAANRLPALYARR
ncbi:MAG: hypothetical protein N2652_03665 [Kiritimatiellae bacterium]|nr:hypothetical protein [Kiritimatiellia bacterium]